MARPPTPSEGILLTVREWRARGAELLTPPIDRGVELRCYMRDPDGHLVEVGQATGLLDEAGPTR